MLKDNQKHNESVAPNSAFLSELQRALPQFFTADRHDEQGELIAKGGFDLAGFERALKARNIDELSSGYQLDFIGKDYAKKQAGEKPVTVIVPDVEHNALVENKSSHNLFLTGDNLDVLRHLQSNYASTVDMIYIDPPYNTGSDGFVYPDHFEYSDRALQDMFGLNDTELARLKSIQGKSTHSAWLSFMYPRLFLARKLLKDTGFIFISIDDNEHANLKLMMDEIFGEGGFITNVMWKRKKEISNDSDNVSIQGEYILVYAKTARGALRLEPLSKEYIQKSYKEPTAQFPAGKWRPVPLTVSKGLSGGGYTYKITTPNGTVHERLWAYPEASYQKLVADNLIYFGKDNGGIPQRVMYAHHSKGQPTTNYWDNVASNKEGKKEILDLFGDNVFDTPKPTALLKKIIKLAIDKDGVVLDFFAGSGTTAHAVMALNEEDGGQRAFILCTLDQTLSHNTIANKAGYNTIDEISRERIKRVAAKIRARNPATTCDLGFKHYRFVTPTQQTLDDLDSFDIATGHFINTSGQLTAFSESGFTDMITPFSASGLGVPGGAGGEETLLTTWLVADGYKMDIETQPVAFSGYRAMYVDNTRLYLINERWGTQQTRDLLNQLGTHQLPVQTIVIYGYSFDLESLRELEIGLKQLDQKVNLVKRY